MKNSLHIVEEKSWYSNGLSFSCTECGKCCTGAPGYVWITEQEIIKAAEFLNLSIEQFTNQYLRVVEGRISLKENSQNFDCIFLKEKKCHIYPVRPKQCRTFPWWKRNLESQEAWNEAALFCEGINNSSEKVSFEKIEEQLKIQESFDQEHH